MKSYVVGPVYIARRNDSFNINLPTTQATRPVVSCATAALSHCIKEAMVLVSIRIGSGGVNNWVPCRQYRAYMVCTKEWGEEEVASSVVEEGGAASTLVRRV